MMNREIAYRLKHILGKKSRYITLLKYERGLSEYEISKLTDMSIEEVEKIIMNAVLRIRKNLAISITFYGGQQ